MDDLIPQIDAFRAEHGLSDSAFGEMAMNDRHLIRQLREGRELRRATVGKLRDFMHEYTSEAPALVEQSRAAA